MADDSAVKTEGAHRSTGVRAEAAENPSTRGWEIGTQVKGKQIQNTPQRLPRFQK